MRETRVLWKAMGPGEAEMVEAGGMRAFPPRLPCQAVFYAAASRVAAERMAQDWHLPRNGVGYVARFEVLHSFLDAYCPMAAEASAGEEFRIPAEDMEEFNAAIAGPIEIVSSYRLPAQR